MKNKSNSSPHNPSCFGLRTLDFLPIFYVVLVVSVSLLIRSMVFLINFGNGDIVPSIKDYKLYIVMTCFYCYFQIK